MSFDRLCQAPAETLSQREMLSDVKFGRVHMWESKALPGKKDQLEKNARFLLVSPVWCISNVCKFERRESKEKHLSPNPGVSMLMELMGALYFSNWKGEKPAKKKANHWNALCHCGGLFKRDTGHVLPVDRMPLLRDLNVRIMLLMYKPFWGFSWASLLS